MDYYSDPTIDKETLISEKVHSIASGAQAVGKIISSKIRKKRLHPTF